MVLRRLLASALLAFVSCKRDPIIFSITPEIEFVRITPQQVQEFGSLLIVIRYRDGDGDVGGQPDGAPDLFLIDLRDSTLFPPGYDGILRYNMPRLYEGSAQSIQGTIEITLPGVARTNPNASAEPIAFEIYLKDRAGHESNRVRTDTVFIVP